MKTRSSLIFLGLFISALLFQGSLRQERLQFIGSAALEWKTLSGCSYGGTEKGTLGDKTIVGTFGADTGASLLNCSSEPFTLLSNIFYIEHKSRGKKQSDVPNTAPFYLVLSTETGEQIFRIPFFSSVLPVERRGARTKIELSPEVVGEKVVLTLGEDWTQREDEWIAVKNRIEFFKEQSSFALFDLLDVELYRHLLVAAIVSLLCIGVLQAGLKTSSWSWFALMLACSFIFHFRADAFYYWDEWHALERFKDLGIRGTLYTHNEHFLPLFFFFYYLEAKLFGLAYAALLCVSVFLHALHSYLLSLVLERCSFSQKTSRILSFAFLVSALHAETLHWAFEQSILLSAIASQLVFLNALNFLSTGSKRHLGFATLAALAAPFFFGNGFIVLPILFVLILGFFVGARRVGYAPVRRIATLMFCIGLSLVFPAVCYVLFKDGSGHSLDQASPFSDLTAVFDYLLVGTQLGTVLRGLGLYPSLHLGSAPVATTFLYSIHQGLVSPTYSPELYFANIGAGISLCLLIFVLFQKQKGIWVRSFFVGQAVMFLALVLPALARWQTGVAQALSLRYQYVALIGLCFLCAPFIELFLSTQKRSVRALWFLILFCYLSIQFTLGLEFDYFTENGWNHRNYVAQLEDWQVKRGQFPESNTYEALGTPLQGFHPKHQESITPGRHPLQIQAVIDWLE